MAADSHRGDRARSLSRRRLLTGAAGAAAFSIVRSGAAGATKANSKVTLGVVGTGGRGAWIANLFRQNGGYRLSAVADYFPDVARRAGAALGVDAKRCFSGLAGYQRLIAAKVDAVALETPPWFFPLHAAAAAEAGLHVYMAKPIACDVPGCLAIAAAGKLAAEKKRVFHVDFHKCITAGDCRNETVAPSVNSTLAAILGREAGKKGGKITRAEMIKANRKIEVDTAGLVE